MWFVTKMTWIHNGSSCLGKWARGPVSALFHTVYEAQTRKTTKPNWWASEEKCPWSHLNQSFLQTGFPLISRLRSSPYPRIGTISSLDASDVCTGEGFRKRYPTRRNLPENLAVIYGICGSYCMMWLSSVSTIAVDKQTRCRWEEHCLLCLRVVIKVDNGIYFNKALNTRAFVCQDTPHNACRHKYKASIAS